MSKTPCYNPCEPDDETQEEIPCVDGEPCDPAIDLNCVIYTGEDLPGIGLKKGDRGTKIIQLINQNHQSEGIVTEDTSTIHLTGSGIDSDKLKADVKISDDPDNLLTENNGLLVKFTPEIVLSLFQIIKNNPDIKDAWCETIKECDTCEIITDFTVDIV